MVEECTAALAKQATTPNYFYVPKSCNMAKQPAVAACCVFADDLKAISKLAGVNAVAVGRLVKGLGGGAVGQWKWVVSDYRCFPVLSAVPAAAAAAASGGGGGSVGGGGSSAASAAK
jgi:hypothetical protein